MSWKKASLAILALMLLAPAANAEVTATPDETLTAIAPDATTTVPFTATMACTDFVDEGTITGMGSSVQSFAVTYPAGLSGPATVDVSIPGEPCLTSPTGSSSAAGNLPVTAEATAPGMTRLDITLTASDDTASTISVQVGYRMGHSLIIDREFPIEVGAEPVTWNGTLTVTANADTMVMTQTTEKAQFGTVGGVFPFKNFLDPMNTVNEVQIMFTYTPSATEWTDDKMAFTLWSHFMDDGAQKTDDDMIEWTFVNTNDHGGEPDDSKGSPGFGALSLIGLVAAAAFVARRR